MTHLYLSPTHPQYIAISYAKKRIAVISVTLPAAQRCHVSGRMEAPLQAITVSK